MIQTIINITSYNTTSARSYSDAVVVVVVAAAGYTLPL